MTQKSLAIGLLICGFAALLAGLVWRQSSSPQAFWTAKDAEEYSSAYVAFKSAKLNAGRPGDPANEQKIAAARERFDNSKAALDRAILRRKYSGISLIVIGIAFLVAAVWAYGSLPKSDSTSNDEADALWVADFRAGMGRR